jgi:hypothetical protein
LELQADCAAPGRTQVPAGTGHIGNVVWIENELHFRLEGHIQIGGFHDGPPIEQLVFFGAACVAVKEQQGGTGIRPAASMAERRQRSMLARLNVLSGEVSFCSGDLSRQW